MLLLILSLFALPKDTIKVVTYTASPQYTRMYYYDQHGISIGAVDQIDYYCPDVKFAMVAQPFDSVYYCPRSLYVENGELIRKAAKTPAGTSCVFALTKKNKAVIVPVEKASIKDYKYAVQVGQMLVINGRIDPKLTKSNDIYQRAAYGILRDGQILFMLTQDGVTFQQLAQLLIDRGCVTACYIIGGYSESYWLPNYQRRTDVGVIVAVYGENHKSNPPTYFDFKLNPTK